MNLLDRVNLKKQYLMAGIQIQPLGIICFPWQALKSVSEAVFDFDTQPKTTQTLSPEPQALGIFTWYEMPRVTKVSRRRTITITVRSSPLFEGRLVLYGNWRKPLLSSHTRLLNASVFSSDKKTKEYPLKYTRIPNMTQGIRIPNTTQGIFL